MTPPDDRDEFFIGYAPPLPARLSTFIWRVVTAGSAGVALAAAAIATGHVGLEGGTFEFGLVRTRTGTIVTQPYPALIEDADPAGRSATHRPWRLLVAEGKHGADALVRGFEGARVTIDGTHIERSGMPMLEVRAGSIARTGDARSRLAVPEGVIGGGPVMLRGEIVDSKCFLGVMTPGDGRTHSACASLCLRGGIPPALLVRDRVGHSALYLLEDPTGAPLSAAAADLAGEPVEVGGVTSQRGSWRILRTDPASWTRLGAAPGPDVEAARSALATFY
jgi:hypothetical protein